MNNSTDDRRAKSLMTIAAANCASIQGGATDSIQGSATGNTARLRNGLRWCLLAAAFGGAVATVSCQNKAASCEETLSCAGANAGGGGGEPPSNTGGDTSSGGSDAGACDPKQESCDSDEVVYVSPLGDAEADGSLDEPVSTLARALELVVPGGAIYLCSTEGAYNESLQLTAEHTGLGIYGGFDCEDFAPSEALSVLATTAAGHQIADVDGLTLADLRLEPADGSDAGQSSVGLLVTGSNAVNVMRCEIVAGAGADGEDGSTYSESAEAGPDGNPGATACADPTINLGGAAVTTTCGGATTASVSGDGGIGGLGSGGTDDGGTGGAGKPDDGGGTAGAGEASASCVSGGNGGAGDPGEHGAAAEALGTLKNSGYAPSWGAAGESGALGAAGGGGGGARKPDGCNTGASGGSGGGGGCPGAPAGGGQSGGGSLAVVSFESVLTLSDTHLGVSLGGSGGTGGDGQTGGDGGDPGARGEAGVSGDSDACAGGNGGRGGRGGSGGGGAGGPSIGVAYQGTAPTMTNVTTSLPSDGAPGGAAGNLNGDAAGPAGVVATTQEFSTDS